ncbi:MAG: autotransporter domain-containing protein [Deltaproteobacteria bacterium]|nr:autotransporter domain-containing protein [Deltaproteobacteria bacterium]
MFSLLDKSAYKKLRLSIGLFVITFVGILGISTSEVSAQLSGVKFGPNTDAYSQYQDPSTGVTHIVPNTALGSYAPDAYGNPVSGIAIRFETSGKLYDNPNGILITGTVADYTVVGGGRFDAGGGLAGTASNNFVTVDTTGVVGSGVRGSVYGGISIGSTGDLVVTGNNVVIKGTVHNSVIGGAGAGANVDVKNNKVVIDGGKVKSESPGTVGRVIGGSICVAGAGPCAASGKAVSGNVVEIKDGSEVRAVVGGESINTLTGAFVGGTKAEDANKVMVSGGTLNEVAGGYIHAGAGTVQGNQVMITGGKITGKIAGGESSNANIGNFVSIVGGNLGNVAATIVEIYGGKSHTVSVNTGEVSGNKVVIDNSNGKITITGVITVMGGMSDINGKVEKNEVTLTNVTVATAMGGMAKSYAVEVSENVVTLKGVTTSKANTTVSGNGNVYGGKSGQDSNVTGNQVIFESGTNVIKGNVYGGENSVTSSAKVKDNLVIFKGGDNAIDGTVYVGGKLQINGGKNLFKGSVTTGQANQAIEIKGGVSTFEADLVADVSTGTGSGALLIEKAKVIFGKNLNVKAASLTVNDGGDLDIGKNTVTFYGATLTLKSGAVLSLETDGTTLSGNVKGNTSSVTVMIEDGSKVLLTGPTGSWVGKTIINAGSGGIVTIDPTKVNSGYYKLVVGGTNLLNVSTDKNTTVDVIKNSKIHSTPNVLAGSRVVDSIMAKAVTTPALKPLSEKFETVVTNIALNYGPEVADNALRQLFGDSLANVQNNVSATVVKTQSVVYNRLDRVREIEMNDLTPPAAGDGSELNRIWLGGFGLWAEEESTSTVHGYEYSGAGMAFGYDRRIEGAPGLRLGISASIANGEIKTNDGRTTVNIDTVGIGVYASYTLPNNVFFDANVAYATSDSDYDTSLIVGGKKSGSIDIDSWQFGLRGGVVIKGDGYQIIPSVGIKYTSMRQGAFRDTLDAAAVAAQATANTYHSRVDHQIDIPIQIKFNTTVQSGSVTLTPELRLGYNFAVQKPDNTMEVGFVGFGETYKIHGTRPRGNSFQAGVGLKINTGRVADIFVNYDLDVSSGYSSHTASVGLGFEF